MGGQVPLLTRLENAIMDRLTAMIADIGGVDRWLSSSRDFINFPVNQSTFLVVYGETRFQRMEQGADPVRLITMNVILLHPLQLGAEKAFLLLAQAREAIIGFAPLTEDQNARFEIETERFLERTQSLLHFTQTYQIECEEQA